MLIAVKCMHSYTDVCLKIHKFTLWSCTRFAFTQMAQANTNKPSCTHTDTPWRYRPSGLSPLCPIFSRGQQVSHHERTWLVLNCWQWTRLCPCQTHTNTHTPHGHTNIRCLLAHTHRKQLTHRHSCWHVSVFLTGWQRVCWLYTHTTVQPSGPQLHQSL